MGQGWGVDGEWAGEGVVVEALSFPRCRAGPLHKRRETLALTLEILSPGQPKVEIGGPEITHRRCLPRRSPVKGDALW